jgi:hypothetical protein
MHHALRSSLLFVAIAAIVCLSSCETHDRRIYSDDQDKNLHTPNPWAPSTSKAADEATSTLAMPPGPPVTPNPAAPVPPGAPISQ